MDSLFSLLYLIFLDLDTWGVQTDTKRAPCCLPMLSLFFFFEAGASLFFLFFSFLSYILRLHGRCYGEKEEGRRRPFLYIESDQG